MDQKYAIKTGKLDWKASREGYDHEKILAL